MNTGATPQRSAALPVVIASLVALAPISTDLYLPTLPGLRREFDASAGTVQLTLSVFLVGFALGQLLYGPMSDRFGRRPVLLGGLVLFIAAGVMCLFATSIEMLIAGRFVQAVGACAGPVIGRAMIRDLFDRTAGARMLGYITMGSAAAPALGPFLGGVLTEAYGWRSSFVALALVGVGCLLAAVFVARESNREKDAMALNPSRLAVNYVRLFRSRVFLGYAGCVACGYAGLLSFIASSSFVLTDLSGLTPTLYGITFGSIAIPYMLGCFGGARLSGRLGVWRLVRLGGGMLTLAGLGALAVAFSGSTHPLIIMLPIWCYLLGLGFVLPPAQVGAIAPFPAMAGLASGMVGCGQMIAGAGTGILATQLYDETTLPMLGILCLFGFLTLLVHLTLLRRDETAQG